MLARHSYFCSLFLILFVIYNGHGTGTVQKSTTAQRIATTIQAGLPKAKGNETSMHPGTKISNGTIGNATDVGTNATSGNITIIKRPKGYVNKTGNKIYYKLFKGAHLPENVTNKFKKPHIPNWRDYCDPYHCDDHHHQVCGLHRKTIRFKWFQSGCHISLHNQCAKYRGTVKYDTVESRHCLKYVRHLRMGCETSCSDDALRPVCGVSSIDSHVVLFQNECAYVKANCQSESLNEYEQVDLKICDLYINQEDTEKAFSDQEIFDVSG